MIDDATSSPGPCTTPGFEVALGGPVYYPVADASFPIGTPVSPRFVPDHRVLPGRANSGNTAFITGLAVSPGIAGDRVLVQYAGIVSLTTTEWDRITGETGGLSPGLYYLSSAAEGQLTRSAPIGASVFTTSVGIATSPVDFLLQIEAAVKNS